MSGESCNTEMDVETGFRLARASELARLGALTRAAEVLCERPVAEMKPKELDLLARILTRIGYRKEARRIWEQAAQLEPGNPSHSNCLIALSDAEHYRRFWICVLIGIASVLVLGAAVGWVATTRSKRQSHKTPAVGIPAPQSPSKHSSPSIPKQAPTTPTPASPRPR